MERSVKKDKHQNTPASYNFSEIFYICLSRWYWFVISLILIMGYTAYKNLTTQPVYTRHTEVLIKSNDKGTSLSDQMENFASMGINKQGTNAYNEIYTFRAPEIIEETVSRLDLHTEYSSEDTFYPNVLYGENLPAAAHICDIDPDENAGFDIEITPEKEFRLYNFKGNTTDGPKEVSGDFKNDTITLVSSPLGDIILELNTAFRFDGTEKYTVNHIGLHNAASKYSGRLSFQKNDEESEIIAITINDHSIERADDILAMVIQVYNENWVNDKNKEAEETRRFIDERLADISGELDSIDSNISTFKSDNLLPDIASQSDINISIEKSIEENIDILRNELSSAERFLKDIRSKAQKNTLLPIDVGLSNSSINSQISSYNATMLERNSLASKSSDDSHAVKNLDLALSTQRATIISLLDSHIRGLKAQLASLQKKGKHIKDEIAKTPEQSTFLASAEREQSIKEKIYLFLLQKREENQLSQAFSAYKTRIITPPSGSLEPTQPQTQKSLVSAFLIALLIPAAIIIIKEFSNTKVRGKKDIEHFNIPIAGEIPLYKDKNRPVNKGRRKNRSKEKAYAVVEADNRNIINEAFRVLRTNIEFMTRGSEERIFIYTSFNPGSGKTFCILNTAVSLAIKGNKVLLIDSDLRRASLSTYIDVTTPGLTDYLSQGEYTLDDITRVDGKCPSLHIIPSGTIPPNPTELLESEAFGKFMEDIKGKYDYILIDCPPIDIVADTHIIEKYASHSFFLIRSGLLDRALLPEVERIYSEKKLKNLSVIINGVETKGRKYGYRYGYNYGYGYGSYNYGEKKEKRKRKNK